MCDGQLLGHSYRTLMFLELSDAPCLSLPASDSSSSTPADLQPGENSSNSTKLNMWLCVKCLLSLFKRKKAGPDDIKRWMWLTGEEATGEEWIISAGLCWRNRTDAVDTSLYIWTLLMLSSLYSDVIYCDLLWSWTLYVWSWTHHHYHTHSIYKLTAFNRSAEHWILHEIPSHSHRTTSWHYLSELVLYFVQFVLCIDTMCKLSEEF